MWSIWLAAAALAALSTPMHGQGMKARVTFASSVEIQTPDQTTETPTLSPTGVPVTVRKEHAGAVMKVTGTSSFDATLGPGAVQDAGYDFATPPKGLTAEMKWSNVSVTGGPCTHEVAISPPTPYNFWLGLTVGGAPKAALVVTPDGAELQDIISRNCQKGIKGGGRAKMPIFSQAWTALYGSGQDGDDGSAKSSDDAMAMTQGMDMEKMMELHEAMQEKMKKEGKDPNNLSDEDAERMARGMMDEPGAADMTQQVGKNADSRLDKALDNFMIKMEGPQVTGRATFADYTISRNVDLPGGQGTAIAHTRIVIVLLADGHQ